MEEGSYLNLGGGQIVMWGGHNLPHLIDRGLTDLPNPGWAIAHSVHPSLTLAFSEPTHLSNLYADVIYETMPWLNK